ncbi:MAG: NMD3-related protein [Candidatus Micrarchaeia archaeon]
MEKICPRCGITNTRRNFVGSLCEKCFAATLSVTCPDEVILQRCRACGRFRLKGEWRVASERELGDFITARCRSPAEIISARVKFGEPAKIILLVKADSSFVEVEREARVKREETMCCDCRRTRSGYYEAILQLRGSAAAVERARKKLAAALERSTFIAKTEELREGIDLYVGSRSALQQVLAGFGYVLKPSFKLAGVRGGKRTYRVTYVVRV